MKGETWVVTYTRDVDDAVYTLHDIVEYSDLREILYLDEFKSGGVLWSCGFHLFALLLRACCCTHGQAAC